MEFEYIYYVTDESFDYGDWPGATCYQTAAHGFSLELTKDDVPLLDTIKGFGDFDNDEELKKCTNYSTFYEWLEKSKQYLDENEAEATSIEVIEELQDFVRSQLPKAA